jgi:hypothetical protein
MAITKGKPCAGAEPVAELPDVIHLPDLRQRTKKVTSGSELRHRQHVKRCRYDDDELAEFDARAKARGLTDGAYIRASTLGDAGPRARRRAPVDIVALMQALVAFNRVGNNQNQMTRGLNELLLIAREQSNARLENLVLEMADAILGLPALFAEPVAAILAAVRHDREG